jgi:light-regulated signal transduction histidine kinase (bacteriophytochrome)
LTRLFQAPQSEPDLDGYPIRALSGRETDLSLSDLRAVSPVPIEYLRDIRVAASLSFSIQVFGSLWRLVAYHHRSPRFLSLPVRIGRHCP